MNFHPTAIAGLFEIETPAITDSRGRFTRLYCERALATVAPGQRVLQINHSHSRESGTLRGLHVQREGALEGKLVRCVRGKVFDVAVDLRHHSPTFGRWHSIELSAEGSRQIWIPPGLAHGFQTLVDDSELLYLHTAAHSPAHETGLRFDDPQLAIHWPLPPKQLSARDLGLPRLGPRFAAVHT